MVLKKVKSKQKIYHDAHTDSKIWKQNLREEVLHRRVSKKQLVAKQKAVIPSFNNWKNKNQGRKMSSPKPAETITKTKVLVIPSFNKRSKPAETITKTKTSMFAAHVKRASHHDQAQKTEKQYEESSNLRQEKVKQSLQRSQARLRARLSNRQ